MISDECFESAYLGDSEKLLRILEEGGLNPNIPHLKGGHTLLQAACETDAIESIKVLLKLGADPNKTFTVLNVDGSVIQMESTAIANARSVEAAKLLIDAGADINAIDGYGYSPVVRAAKRRDLTVVDFLCSQGADYKRECSIGGELLTAAQLIEKEILSYREVLGEKLTDNQKKFFEDYSAVQERLES